MVQKGHIVPKQGFVGEMLLVREDSTNPTDERQTYAMPCPYYGTKQGARRYARSLVKAGKALSVTIYGAGAGDSTFTCAAG